MLPAGKRPAPADSSLSGVSVPVAKRPKESPTEAVDELPQTQTQVGFGTYKIKIADLPPLAKAAADAGYPLIDSAAVYENEKALRGLVSGLITAYDAAHGKPAPFEVPMNRSENGSPMIKVYPRKLSIVIQTKVWRSKHGYSAAMTQAIDCMKNLGLLGKEGKQHVQHAELGTLLVHHPGCKEGWPLKNITPDVPGRMPVDWDPMETRAETWRALEDLHQDRRVGAIGVCNFSERQLRNIVERARVRPMIHQFELHPLLQQRGLVEYCQTQGIAIQAFASLGGGDGAAKGQPNSLTALPAVLKVAGDTKLTPQQVLLRWALRKGFTILPKSSQDSRIKDNVHALSELKNNVLTEAHIALIDAAEQQRGTQRLTWKGEDPDVDVPKLADKYIKIIQEQAEGAKQKKEQAAEAKQKKQ